MQRVRLREARAFGGGMIDHEERAAILERIEDVLVVERDVQMVARARGMPAYIIAHDRTLLAMAAQRPRSHAELLDVPGMGPARVEQYGDGFLQVLRDHAPA